MRSALSPGLVISNLQLLTGPIQLDQDSEKYSAPSRDTPAQCELLYTYMNVDYHSPCSAIEQWEETGAFLVTALNNYANMCLDLGAKSLLECVNSRELVSRIEVILAGIHTSMSRHLDESRSALVRTRNKFVSPISSFPEEILSSIFIEVVFDHSNCGIAEPIAMKQAIWLIYRRLYTLISVCSAWRDIAMKRGALWSVIPVTTRQSMGRWRPFELSLQRASGSLLHLAAVSEFSNQLGDPTPILVEHGPRFRTINISTEDPAEIEGVIKGLLQHGTLESLSELSLQCIATRSQATSISQGSDYIIPRNSPHQTLFAELVRGLSVFRIGGAQFHWDTMGFSTKLVELRIQQVNLGYDDAFIPLMRSLASAPNLRDLKIISVSTFRNWNSSNAASSCAALTFPALRSLLLRDLYLNTLKYLLPMMAAGSYPLTLFLTPRFLEINTPLRINSGRDRDFEELYEATKRASIDTLMLDGSSDDEWLGMSKIGRLIKAMPTLKTLKIHKWSFGKGLCKNLARINKPQTSEGPTFHSIHLTSVQIHAKKEFQDMVTSHPLQHIVLGGDCLTIRPNRGSHWEHFQEGSGIIQDLRENSPDLHFKLVESDHQPPDFEPVLWKLW